MVQPSSPTVAVDEACIRDTGWVPVDLERVRAQMALPLRVPAIRARLGPWVTLSARPAARRPALAARERRVPLSDIVCIGRALDLGALPPGCAAAPSAANENARLRLLLLLVLAFALSGTAYWAMRLSQPNVIVVPAPSSDRTMIT